MTGQGEMGEARGREGQGWRDARRESEREDIVTLGCIGNVDV